MPLLPLPKLPSKDCKSLISESCVLVAVDELLLAESLAAVDAPVVLLLALLDAVPAVADDDCGPVMPLAWSV